jgi:hypothetical protein
MIMKKASIVFHMRGVLFLLKEYERLIARDLDLRGLAACVSDDLVIVDDFGYAMLSDSGVKLISFSDAPLHWG